jgi:hypothetical protein
LSAAWSFLRRTCLALLLVPLGCIQLPTRELPPIPDDDLFILAPDEGILVVDVASELLLDRVIIGNQHVLVRSGPLHLVVVKAGVYSFDRAHTRLDNYRHYWVFPFDWLERNEFEVIASRVNYPGKLIIKDTSHDRFTARVVNRSATVLPALTSRFPSLLKAYPIRYAGPTRDDFYDEYLGISDVVEVEGGDP